MIALFVMLRDLWARKRPSFKASCSPRVPTILTNAKKRAGVGQD
jgi:hypothetical protein